MVEGRAGKIRKTRNRDLSFILRYKEEAFADLPQPNIVVDVQDVQTKTTRSFKALDKAFNFISDAVSIPSADIRPIRKS